MIRLASPADKDLVVSVLSQAFDTNKSVNFVVKQDSRRKARLRGLMSYSFDVCHSFGDILMADNACALTIFPDRKKTSLKSTLWDIKLATNVVGLSRIMKILDRENKIKKNHPVEPFCYLWFIGVAPNNQRQGLGSNLLTKTIELCDRRRRPIYLETSVEENLPWYKNHGFEIFETIDLGYKLYFLRRPVSEPSITTA